jgi:N-acetylmuramoyl-L-alanine amidase
MRIIPRSEWGARYANGFGHAPVPAAEVWLHHSVTATDNGAAAIRALEQIGQNRFGGGISYTWPITPDGTIYEGHSADRQGSHTANRNGTARAVCFIGNYDIDHPTTAQIRSAAWLLQHAHRSGWIRAPRLDGGHRDLKQTACPGQHAYAAIPTINQLAAGGPIQEDDLSWNETFPRVSDGKPVMASDYLRWTSHNIDQALVQLRALAGALPDGDARILAAVQRVQTAVEADNQTVTPEQLEDLANALAAKLPAEMVDEFDRKLRAAFARAGQSEGGTA